MSRPAWLVAAAALSACASPDVDPTQPGLDDAPATVGLASPSGGDGTRTSPAVSTKPAVRDDYAYWQRLDDEATLEYTTANAFRMLAVATGNHAAAGEANLRHDAAFERHMLYSVKANLAWNREHGVRAGAK
ncbi:MAG: hypothetical protein K8T90_20745 [Planctomycetes bacterium]|nr:hypothetical protein [Planctomycetota bacterium]